MSIKLAFPVKGGDSVEVNGEKYKVKKILGTYTPYCSTSTVETAILLACLVSLCRVITTKGKNTNITVFLPLYIKVLIILIFK